jgi:hypothetical protein
MTIGPEAKLWKALKPHLEAKGCLSTRIENRHGGGLPDIDVSSPFGNLKVELKVTFSFSVNLSDMQIAYNTLLNHKNGLSFILAEHRTEAQAHSFVEHLFMGETQGPRTANRASAPEALGPRSGRVGAIGSGRVGSGRGKSGRVGATGVGDRYWLFHGRDAVEVGRVGLRAEALVSGDSLPDVVAVMLAVCEDHHLRLLGKGPGR